MAVTEAREAGEGWEELGETDTRADPDAVAPGYEARAVKARSNLQNTRAAVKGCRRHAIAFDSGRADDVLKRF